MEKGYLFFANIKQPPSSPSTGSKKNQKTISRMRSLALAFAFSCLLTAVRPSWTMKETPSSAPLHPSSGLSLQDGDSDAEPEVLELQGVPDKRAYTYVSEYKRLPIYNFGLGKRWDSGSNLDEEKVRSLWCGSPGGCNRLFQRARLYSFGLGKRARPYNFGLGKRGEVSSSEDQGFPFHGPEDYVDLLSRDPLDDILEKRSRPYSFGLGKRTPGAEEHRGEYGQRFNFGLGKRPSEDYGHRYKFGLGKRRLVLDDQQGLEVDQQQPIAS